MTFILINKLVMSALLIIIAITAVGKIHGQEAVAFTSQAAYPRPLPSRNQRPVLHREYDRHQTTVPTTRLYTNSFRPSDDDTSESSGNYNINLTPPTVKGYEPRQKLYLSVRVPAEMNRPSERAIDNGSQRNSAEVKNDIKVMKSKLKNDNLNLVTPSNETSKNATNVKLKDKSNEIPVVVDLDERSSFSGDPCPPGFVRVNNECVKTD